MRRYRAKAVLLLLAGALALGLLTLAWAIGSGPSEADQGAMHNCPQPGKWSIAVWDGPSGTETGQALATCGEGVVDFVYYIDPDTQSWLRYFVGRTEINTLLALDEPQGVIAHGAVGVAPPNPTPTPTPTATPTATPTEGYSFTFSSFFKEPDTFRGTVQEIRMMNSIPGGDFYPAATPPEGGEFAVVLMAVTNIGSEGAGVDYFSFRLRDDQDRLFTMDFAEAPSAQWAAETYFDRLGLYDTIMPGITLEMVFVFLVPDGTTGLVAERYPTDGY